MKNLLKTFTIILLILMGALSVFLTSSVFMDWFGIREREGNYILSIVWINWFSGFLFLISAYGLIKKKSFPFFILLINLLLLLIGLIILFLHIKQGLPYELETIRGMVIRTILTLGFIWVAKTNVSDTNQNKSSNQ